MFAYFLASAMSVTRSEREPMVQAPKEDAGDSIGKQTRGEDGLDCLFTRIINDDFQASFSSLLG